jgi:hypothetical protein
VIVLRGLKLFIECRAAELIVVKRIQPIQRVRKKRYGGFIHCDRERYLPRHNLPGSECKASGCVIAGLPASGFRFRLIIAMRERLHRIIELPLERFGEM